MSYKLTFQGSQATQKVVGLVESNFTSGDVSSTASASAGSTTGFTLNAPMAPANPNVAFSYTGQVLMGPNNSSASGTTGYTVTFTSGANNGLSYSATYYNPTGGVNVSSSYFYLASAPASAPAINDTYTVTGPGISGSATGTVGEDSNGNWYYPFLLASTPVGWVAQTTNTAVISSGSSYGASANFSYYNFSSVNIALLQVPRGITPNPFGNTGTLITLPAFDQAGYQNYQWYMPPSMPTAAGMYGSWDGVNNFGGWLAFVNSFSTGTDSTGVTGVNWPQWYGLNNDAVTNPIIALQQTFNGITFNFLVTQAPDTTNGPFAMFGVEVLPSGTVAGDLAIIQTYLNLCAQNYNLFNGAIVVSDPGGSTPDADVATYLASGPTAQPFPASFLAAQPEVSIASVTSTPILGGGLNIIFTLASVPAGFTDGTQTCMIVDGSNAGTTLTGQFETANLTFTYQTQLHFNGFLDATLLIAYPTWFTTTISGNSLVITLNPAFPNVMGTVAGSIYPYLLMGTAPNLTQSGTDNANYTVYGVENSLNDVKSGASSPGASAYGFLTGILFDSTGNLQTQPVITSGHVASVNTNDRNDISIDNGTKNAMQAAGFYSGLDNITLTWLPNSITASANATVKKAQGNTLQLSSANMAALSAVGITPVSQVSVLVTSGHYTGKTYNGTLTGGVNLSIFGPSLATGTTLTISAPQSDKTLNTGTWSGGRWNGNSTISFDNCYLPHGTKVSVLSQNFNLSQIVGGNKGTYQVTLYDSTMSKQSAISVSGKLDLDNDRDDLFNPPPLVQVRVDSTYGYDSQTGKQLYPALLSNQQDYNASLTLSSGSTLSGSIITLTAADNAAMWTAGFQPYSNVKTSRNAINCGDHHGHHGLTSIWDGNGTITLDSTPPGGFTGPFTMNQNVRPDPHRIMLALNPAQYATGMLKIVYSGTINKTVNSQMITSPTVADAFNWPAADETLESAATTSAFEVGLNGHGNITITIPFTITSV